MNGLFWDTIIDFLADRFAKRRRYGVLKKISSFAFVAAAALFGISSLISVIFSGIDPSTALAIKLLVFYGIALLSTVSVICGVFSPVLTLRYLLACTGLLLVFKWICLKSMPHADTCESAPVSSDQMSLLGVKICKFESSRWVRCRLDSL